MFCLAVPLAADAANYPLEITFPRQSLPASHRLFKAYPGLTYNIRAAVVGGLYPFSYSLSNAPSGMTINSQTGEINWVNPTSNATPSLMVRDAEGAQVSVTWSITVSPNGFRFVDANAPSGGTGTMASPWRTLADVKANGTAPDCVYFRTGAYNVSGIAVSGGAPDNVMVEFDRGDDNPVCWLEYPGDSAVIDFLYDGAGSDGRARIRLVGNSVYVDGFEGRNMEVMGFQVGHENGQGSIFRRLQMHDLLRGVDGGNSAFIMTIWSGGVNEAYGMVVQDSVFNNSPGTSSSLKFYSTHKLLVEDCVFSRSGAEALAVKMDNVQFTARANTFFLISGDALGGSMMNRGPGHYGEFCFNNVRDAGTGPNGTVSINQNGESSAVFIYRNTLQGRAVVYNTDSADGPFRFYHNVLVSSDPLGGCVSGSRINCQSVTDPSRILATNNLEGTPSQNIVDASGNLTAAYQSYLGTRGHQIGAGGPPPPSSPIASIPHQSEPYHIYWNNGTQTAPLDLTANNRGPKGPGALWNYTHETAGGWNSRNYMRFYFWDYDVSGVDGGMRSGWNKAGSVWGPPGDWQDVTYYMRFRVRVNAPLLPHSSGRSAGMKWFIWGGFYLPDPPGGQVRNITYFYNGAAHGGDDLQYTTVKLGAGVSASSVQALIPNYQWVHVQTAFKWGSEGVGFQRIYVNNNNVGSPTAENMQFNDLTSQTWTFPGSALDNQMFWADIVSDNSRIREDAVIDIMDMEIDDQFDPAWYPGGGPPPPPSPGSRCDVDVSGSTNVVDVQLCVNQVLGTSGCSAGDIDLNGSCNVVDVQRVVNAALGGACVAQ